MEPKHKKTKIRTITKLAMLSAFMLSANASADIILEHSGTVDLGTTYHSNIQLIEEDSLEESVYVYSIAPRYQFKALDGKNTWSGLFGLNLSRSSNSNIARNREDPLLLARWQRELERGQLGLSYGYRQESTRIAQALQTGLVAQDGTEKTQTLRADWKYFVTDRVTLDLLGQYEKSKFTDAESLRDRKDQRLRAALDYKLNERLTPFVSVEANTTETTGLDKIDYQNYQAGTRMLVSPNLNFMVSLGNTHVSNTGVDKITGGATVNFVNQRSTASIGFTRTVTPLDSGVLEVLESFEADYLYDLSAKDKLGMSLATGETDLDFRGQEISGFYSHQFTQSWLFRLSLGLVNTKQSPQDSADDKTIGITFTYNSPKFL